MAIEQDTRDGGALLDAPLAQVHPAARAARMIVYAVLASALVIFVFGWGLGMPGLVQVTPAFPSTAPSTAGAFVIAAAAMAAGPPGAEGSTSLLWRRVAAAAIAALAATSLILEFSGVDGGLDRFLITDWRQNSAPRMAVATSICFLLFALALVAPPGLLNGSEWLPCVFSSLGFALACIALAGYAFDAVALYDVWIYSAMSLPTALVFAALFLAQMLERHDSGWMALLIGPGAGSINARRVMPFVVLGPLVLCWLGLVAAEAGLVNANFTLSVLALMMIVLLSAAVLRAAGVQNQNQRRLRKTMAELEAAVADRDLYLRELDHRVKNNLQLASALVLIQSRKSQDPSARAALESISRRIVALGTVQNILTADGFQSEPWLDELLKSLGTAVASANGAESRNIALEVAAPHIRVSTDFATVICLIANEAVTNSLKHAFFGRAGGRIGVECAVSGEQARLVVSDDGVGVGDRAARRDGGQGVEVIEGLVRRLNGSTRIENGTGTKLCVEFPAIEMTRGAE